MPVPVPIRRALKPILVNFARMPAPPMRRKSAAIARFTWLNETTGTHNHDILEL